MASVELSRRVEKVVGYPPLSEMGDRQRREFHLLVFASLRVFGVTCTVGSANAFLYLDGVGVPGSGQRRPTTANANQYTAIALTDPVPAGEHTLRISYDCPDGNPTADSSANDGDLGAVLIGG